MALKRYHSFLFPIDSILIIILSNKKFVIIIYIFIIEKTPQYLRVKQKPRGCLFFLETQKRERKREMEEEEHEVYGGEIPDEGEMEGDMDSHAADVDMSAADDDAVKVLLFFSFFW